MAATAIVRPLGRGQSMKMRLVAFCCWCALGIQVAVAQDASTLSRDMEAPGNPTTAASITDVDAASPLQGFDSDLPTAVLAKIAQTPVTEEAGLTRDIKD